MTHALFKMCKKFFSDSLTLEDGSCRLSRNVVWNYHSTLHNISEERRSPLCVTLSVAVENNLCSVIEITKTRKEVPLKCVSKRIISYTATNFVPKCCDVNEIILPHQLHFV